MEKPIVFGEAENLFGIVNVPEKIQSPTAVVMLTAGMLHHVGSFRFHVLLARELEKRGLLSFRFDLSGIGESLAVGGTSSSLDRAADEVLQAIDLLEHQYGIDNVILFGLCSGADDGWHVAKLDKRVHGLAMIDGLGYPTAAYYRWALLAKIQKMVWPSFWSAKLRKLWQERPMSARSLLNGTDIREFPSRDIAAQDLQHFMERGVRILACYTGGSGELINYKSQFQEMFPNVRFTSNVEYEFYPEMDHVTLLKEDRKKMLERLAAWMANVALESRGTKAEAACL